MNELIAKCVREEVYEAKQRDMRRKNVIVRNLPEPAEDKTDEDNIKLLTDELGITQKVNITEAKRLGNEGKKDGDDRPRLLHTCQPESSHMTEIFPIDDARELTRNGRRACTMQSNCRRTFRHNPRVTHCVCHTS